MIRCDDNSPFIYPLTKKLFDTYKQKYNEIPIEFSFCTYDAISAWQTAVKKAASYTPEKVSQALKGLAFTSTRGNSYIRTFDGQMVTSVYAEKFKYSPEYSLPIMKPLIEIKASQTLLYEDEIQAIR
ncbi:hypothetical protein H0A36_20340 [Endozoicomonas sp. SM1973]|uniref:Leucine-binding protein domain-containing protein n=1 Tax=Spartinivicinus marinus TaxID=2994442 RepID=A0A853IEH5_9GAMM|nr:ABC transporter substrate-binding protein [Spartinivicinus marinus]MCX4028004.1 hypothetical protein [Spartinivicinus marinus]NYZ68371.1 hypothetical protein [Spartinivicinus marinus]